MQYNLQHVEGGCLGWSRTIVMLNVPEQHCFAFTVGYHWVLGEDQVGRMLTMKELKEREQNDRGKNA